MNEAKKFIMWLDGYLDACGDTLNEKETNKITERLENVFYNEAEESKKALFVPESKSKRIKVSWKQEYEDKYRC